MWHIRCTIAWWPCFWKTANIFRSTIFVRISENREEISVLAYRAKLAELIQRIVEAYWAVVFATDNLRLQEKGVDLAAANFCPKPRLPRASGCSTA